MKNIKIVFVFISMLIWSSCSDFLDTKDLVEKTNATFPINANDFDQAIAAVYAAQRDAYFNQIDSYLGIASYMDDDYVANGRALFDDPMIRAFERYQVRNMDQFLSTWQNFYKGIFRANFVLESLEKNNAGLTEAQKGQLSWASLFFKRFYVF